MIVENNDVLAESERFVAEEQVITGDIDLERLIQEAKGDLGSYWHGMLHRREGDFDNARYWFRRAGVLR